MLRAEVEQVKEIADEAANAAAKALLSRIEELEKRIDILEIPPPAKQEAAGEPAAKGGKK